MAGGLSTTTLGAFAFILISALVLHPATAINEEAVPDEPKPGSQEEPPAPIEPQAPRKTKPPAEPEPEPVRQESTPATPAVEKSAPEPAPEPVVKKPAPAPESVVEKPAPTPAPAPKPVVEKKPAAVPAPAPVSSAKPAAAAPKPRDAEKPTSIIDKCVGIIFGSSNTPRSPKWAEPWQTHPEFKKVKVETAPKVKKVDTSPGIIDKFVGLLFGQASAVRDAKYAEPWQTHAEHKKEPKVEVVQKAKKVDTSPGIIDKFVSLLFGNPSAIRDPKYAEPWQTHTEHKKTPKAEAVEEKVVVRGATGGLIDKLAKLVFTTVKEGTKRDPKWAEPWQSLPEFAKKADVKEEIKEKVVVSSSGGIINAFVKLFFATLPEGTKKDPKWAEPWQTHPEYKRKDQEVSKDKPATKVVVGPSGGLIDKLACLVFTTPPKDSKRDPKWSQPWQTHPEHAGRSLKAEEPKETKKVVVGASGGLIDRLTRIVFDVRKDTDKRDPKWIQPWQSHAEHAKPAPPLKQKPEPVAPPPHKKPEPVTPSKKAEPEAPAPPQKPEPAPVRKVEPAPSPKPAPAPAPVPVPEPNPAVMPEKFHDAGGAPAAASTGDAPLADAPPPPHKPVLEQEGPKTPPPPPSQPQEEQIVVPSSLRSRDRLENILGLDQTSQDVAARIQPIAQATLTSLKAIYENTVKPLETLYKYQDISNRHVSDAELFGTPLVLLVGPYSTGKSSFINYLLGIEYTKRALKTGTPPSHGVFRVIQYGETDSELDGTALSAQRFFSSLQKYGQNFVDQLHGKAFKNPLLKKVTLVEAPGILEMRRPGERLYPYNDVVQWFIDRSDLILVMFDYTKLDAGYELEAILDQLKGRESQTRILLNKADQVAAEELIKVQGSLFWNLSPLLGISSPPTVYAGSFASRPYRSGSSAPLFQAQEEALLGDVAKAINARVDNRIAIARRHAVRVRNHAQMVDTYLATFYRNKGFLTSKHKLVEDIVENPHSYNIYEGLSLLTNISRYDLPDPEVYRDFFRVHNLYDFQTLKATCSYFRGCPLTKIDAAISTELPELQERYRRLQEAALAAPGATHRPASTPVPAPAPAARGSVPAAATARTS